ncbi:MAG TPA: hypothetical protein VJH33_02910 [Candidatus Paceibacterota bacterium]
MFSEEDPYGKNKLLYCLLALFGFPLLGLSLGCAIALILHSVFGMTFNANIPEENNLVHDLFWICVASGSAGTFILWISTKIPLGNIPNDRDTKKRK